MASTLTPPFVAHCLELLGAAGPARARAMFGGHGLYLDGLFIAVVAFERLYLKVDDLTRADFERAGGQPFVYDGKGKSITMSYWTPPSEALDSPALMQPWARRALEAALRARAGPSARRSTRPAPARPKGSRPPAAVAAPAATTKARKRAR